MAILVIEQNIGVATTVSENVAIMVNGRINRIIESRRLAADRELQQRLLGVGRHSDAAEPDRPEPASPGASAPRPASAAKPSGAPIRIYVSNPTPPTRWSQPAPNARIESAARIASAESRKDRNQRPAPSAVGLLPSGPPVVIVAGTLDTKGVELRFIRDLIVASGLRTRLVDVSTSGKPATCDVTAQEDRAQPWPRRLGGVRPRPRRFGRRDGGSVRDLDQAPGRHCRHYQRRRVGRRLDRRPGDARPSHRRAQAADLFDRLRRRQPLCRPDRHHDDVFGHRRSGPELDLSAGARQRRPGFDRDGEGPA